MKVGAASAIKLAWLVVDFDGTCTVRDTTPTIACLAAAHNNGGVEQLSSFGVHERDYMEGHARLLGGGELEAEPSAAVDVAALSAFLAALDDHSTRTTREVSRSGVLAGLDGARVAETFTAWAAGEVVGQLAPQPPPSLQPGCAAALAAAAAAGCRLGVLSVNWCPALIHALLAPPLGADAPAAETLTVAPPYELWCNSLAPDGRVRLAVAGAAQKARKIDGLVRAARRDGGGGAVACVLSTRILGAQFGAILLSARAIYRYVGDSATDLTALLAADVGILVGTSESARRIARRFGVKLAPLPAELPELPAAEGGGGSGGGAVIYEAASWEQIRSALGFGGGAAAV